MPIRHAARSIAALIAVICVMLAILAMPARSGAEPAETITPPAAAIEPAAGTGSDTDATEAPKASAPPDAGVTESQPESAGDGGPAAAGVSTPETSAPPTEAPAKLQNRAATADVPVLPGTVVVPGGNNSTLAVTLTQVSAGRGQNSGRPCAINTANGFPEDQSDETTTDGNACAGDAAEYSLALSKTASTGPSTYRIKLRWVDADTGSWVRSDHMPTRVVTTAGQNGVTVQAVPGNPSEVLVTFEGSEPQSVTLKVSVDVSPYDSRAVYPLKGEYRLIGTVKPEIEEGGTGAPVSTNPVNLDSDKPLNVLRIERFDLGVATTSVDPANVVIDGVSYRVINAQPAVNRVTYPGYDEKLGINGTNAAKLWKQLVKYTLDSTSLPEGVNPNEVLSAVGGDTPGSAELDRDGNPSVQTAISGPYLLRDGRSGFPTMKFYIPTKNIPKKKGIEISSRFDAVDSEGNLTKITGVSGELSQFPLFKDNPDFGGDEVDPGSRQGKNFSTGNDKAGTRPGSPEHYPNNNWVKHTLDLSEYECGEGEECSSTKEDQSFGRGITNEADGKRNAFKSAPVKLTINPTQGRNNPRICVTWKPGYQRLAGDKRIHVGDDPRVAPSLKSVYPNARVYYTNMDLVGDGSGEPDCSKNNFKLGDEGGLDGFFGEGTGPSDVSGFLIEIDGDGVFTKPTALTYTADGFDPSAIKKNPETINGGRYYTTRNYLRVASSDGEFSNAVSDIIYQPIKPSVNVREMSLNFDRGRKAAPGSGKHPVTITTFPRIHFIDGFTTALNGTDANGEPNRFYTRVYLSRCLRVNANSLPPGITYVRNTTLSDDSSDCAVSKDHYLERTWLLGDRENTTGDPRNDPVLPVGFGDGKESEDNRLVWRNNEPPVFSAKVETPAWALPDQEFPIVVDSFGTGMRHLKDPAASTRDENARYVPRGYTDPVVYYPVEGNSVNGTIYIPRIDILSADKSVVEESVPLNGDVAFITTVSNNSETSYGDFEYIDVLPYNGDARGTDYNGTYMVKSVERVAASQPDMAVFYTTEDPATVSACPATATHANELGSCAALAEQDEGRSIDETPTNTDWKPLTPEAIAAQKGPDGKRITALKFRGGPLKTGDSSQMEIVLGTEGNHNRDVYGNNIGVTTLPVTNGSNPPIPAPAPVRAEVYSGQITGTVYDDVENTGGRVAGDDPREGVTVTLLDGDTVIATAVTDDRGNYDFDNLVPGKYTVRIDVPEGMEVTQSGRNPANNGSSEVTDLTVPANRRDLIDNIDFGLFSPRPAITVDKSVNGGDTAALVAKDEASFTITGENTGNAVLNHVRLADDWSAGALDISCVLKNATGSLYPIDAAAARGDLLSADGATLDPGDSYACTATHTVTQENIDARQPLTNHVTVTADYRGTPVGPVEDTVTVTLPDDAAISIEKSVEDRHEPYIAGDQISYRFTLRNEGSLTLHDVTVTDPLLGNTPNDCPTLLTPGQEVTCSATEAYVVTEADAAAKKIDNTATVSGRKPGDDATVEDDSTLTLVAGEPGIAIEKTNDIPAGKKLRTGDPVIWTITVTNTGDTPLNDVTVTDEVLEARGVDLECSPAVPAAGVTLAPNGGQIVCTGRDEITQADIDAETTLVNTAGTSGRYGTWDDSPTATAEVEVSDLAGMTITKSVIDPKPEYTSGDRIRYRFVIRNTGDVTLKNITVTDPMLEQAGVNLNCAATDLESLDPGSDIVCESDEYEITDDDVSGGKDKLVNHVDVSALTPTKGRAVADPDGSDATVNVGLPHLTVKKENITTEISGTQDVEWKITVSNDGTTALENVTLTDQLVADSNGSITCPGNPGLVDGTGISMDSRSTAVCTARITLDQTAVDAAYKEGSVSNTVGAEGTFNGRMVTAGPDTAVVPVALPADLTLTKNVIDEKEAYVAGDTIDYSFTVTNTGKVTLDRITVEDVALGDVNCDATTLRPDESTDCSAAGHVLTPGDIDTARTDTDGTFTNTATAHAATPTGENVDSREATATVTVGEPGITVLKTADRSRPLKVGEDLTYMIAVTNSGGTPVDGVTLSDPMLDGRNAVLECGDHGDITSGGVTLAIAERVTCTATVRITQDDLETAADGTLVNVATVVGDFHGRNVSGSSAVTTPLDVRPELTLEKKVAEPDRQYTPGSEVVYGFTVTNTGTVAVTGITLDDPKLKNISCPKTELGRGESMDCRADALEVDEETARKGVLLNTATVRGETRAGTPVEATDSVTVDTGVPGLVIAKSSSAEEGVEAGDTITWTIRVRNSGGTPVENVRLSDPMLGDAELTCVLDGETWTNGSRLDVGQVVECTAETTVTQEQVDAESGIVNTATVTGGFGDFEIGELTAKATTPVSARSGLTVAKSVVGYEEGMVYRAGDEITYEFAVTNTGAVSLRDIVVEDAQLAAAGVEITCDNSTPLKPGETRVCTSGAYTVTPEQAEAGTVVNTATVNGVTPTKGINVTSEESGVSVPAADPRLVVAKSAEPTGPVAPGDTVTFTVSVRNEGNAAIEDLKITDRWLTDRGVTLDCGDAAALTGDGLTLPAGEEKSCTAEITVTDADLAASGDLVNTATAAGSVGGRPVQGNESTATVTLKRDAAITLSKDVVDPKDTYRVGDTVTFTYTVTNTGTVPLTGVTVLDATVAGVSCPATTLAPGESMTCTSAPHVITEKDAATGTYGGPATVTGTIPESMDPDRDDRTVSDTDSAEVKVERGTGFPGSSGGGIIPIPIPIPGSSSGGGNTGAPIPGSSGGGIIPIPIPGGEPTTGPQNPTAPVAPSSQPGPSSDTPGGTSGTSDGASGTSGATDGAANGGGTTKGLPVTGANVLVALGVGGVLALAGFGLMAADRRRRRDEQ
ncbi:hypothetical protein OS127_09255 [Corynebacterium sp. P6129]|uniref:DUF7507 domain-containing protein n=1 Tax=Corynebacterium antarcticum TaxID=2800405 RepID=UPI002260B524|nr:SdrD B-like domain-containing protein [Corynebacterium antarcticum]MCX7492703.1 hypothetical protein [Corynebacterium antarcticum]